MFGLVAIIASAAASAASCSAVDWKSVIQKNENQAQNKSRLLEAMIVFEGLLFASPIAGLIYLIFKIIFLMKGVPF